jgi:hypothetical protein
MDGSEEDFIGYNFFARPVVAGVATVGLLAFSGGLTGGAQHIAKQVAAGAGCVMASDYASGMFFGGDAGALLSPAMSGVGYFVIQKMLFKVDNSMLDLVLSGAAIDIGSQWMLNPVGRALGLV